MELLEAGMASASYPSAMVKTPVGELGVVAPLEFAEAVSSAVIGVPALMVTAAVLPTAWLVLA